MRGLLLSLFLFASPALAGQYDVALSWPDAATAKADPLIQKYRDALEDLFLADRVVRVQVWRPSQDTTDGDGNTVHNYLSVFAIVVSLTAVPAALSNASAVQFILDRDRCNAKLPGCVVYSNLSGALLKDIRFEPVFSGAKYPWGGLP